MYKFLLKHKKTNAGILLSIGITIASLFFILSPKPSFSVEGFISIGTNITLAAGSSSDTSPFLNDRIFYTDQNNNKQYVDNSWQPDIAPWNWEMTHDDYNIKVKTDITQGQVIEFSNSGETVYFQPLNLQWSNDLSQIQPIAIPGAVTATVGTESEDLIPGVNNNMGYIRWDDAYGTGINFQWQCTPGTLEKYLEIESLNNLVLPEQYIIDGGNPFLELSLVFAPSKNLQIYVNNQLWDQKTKVQTFDVIQFNKNGTTLWTFKPLRYWCSDNGLRDGESIATLSKVGNKLYISIRVPYSWLQQAIFPVYIDADVAIETSAYTSLNVVAMRGGLFWTSTTNAYLIYRDANDDLVYRKTVNGGANWGNATSIKAGTMSCYDCWSDWQTAGDSGTKIHIAYQDLDTDDVRYCYLDTSTDSVGGDDQIEACQGTGALYNGSSMYLYGLVSITKSRGGNIAVAFKYLDSASTKLNGFYTSPDGDTWTNKITPFEDDDNDYIQIYPGNEADNQDLWASFWDMTASEISLKTFDNSENSWSETTISGAGNAIITTLYLQMDGQIRLSDGHLIFSFWNQFDNAASDLLVYDINGSGSITAKTNIITDESESFTVSVFINQVNDDIYVTYCSGSNAQATVDVFYQKSTNGGTNWGGETAMAADGEDDMRWVSGGCIKAVWGGKFEPILFNDDLNDILCNTTNAVTINAAAGVEITNTQATWTIGDVAINDIVYFSATGAQDDDYSMITNTGGVAVDIVIQGSDFEGGDYDWILASSAGNQQYCLYANSEATPTVYDIEVKKTGPNYLVINLAISGTYYWSMKFTAPTAFHVSDDGLNKSATVTLVASEHT